MSLKILAKYDDPNTHGFAFRVKFNEDILEMSEEYLLLHQEGIAAFDEYETSISPKRKKNYKTDLKTGDRIKVRFPDSWKSGLIISAKKGI